jgi:hypothetical protein
LGQKVLRQEQKAPTSIRRKLRLVNVGMDADRGKAEDYELGGSLAEIGGNREEEGVEVQGN